VIPVAYVSMATPHLGAKRYRSPFNLVGEFSARIYWRGQTLKELYLEDGKSLTYDGHNEEDLPLLWRMSLAESSHMKALQMFKYCTLFSNVEYDLQVPYCTSAISPYNPHNLPKDSSQDKSHRVVAEYGFTEETQYPIIPVESTRRVGDHFVVDNQNEVVYLPAILENLQKNVNWLRIDFYFHSFFAHDYFISKNTLLVGKAVEGQIAAERLAKLLISQLRDY